MWPGFWPSTLASQRFVVRTQLDPSVEILSDDLIPLSEGGKVSSVPLT